MTVQERGCDPAYPGSDVVGLSQTFVVTLKLDQPSFERLSTLRGRYFPPSRNLVPAHLTLLHRLDARQADRLLGLRLRLLAEPPIALEFRALRLMGRGVSVGVCSSSLLSLRAALVASAGGKLTRQDQQGFRPHVTVQNKVPAEQAQATLAHLSETFTPWCGVGGAVLVWRYVGGPWELDHELPFANH